MTLAVQYTLTPVLPYVFVFPTGPLCSEDQAAGSQPVQARQTPDCAPLRLVFPCWLGSGGNDEKLFGVDHENWRTVSRQLSGVQAAATRCRQQRIEEQSQLAGLIEKL